ncbi:hypothetical protein JTE90_006406 [Oedothorax gibbosus]|uniref:DNA excision repair protein ERCC-1 n=1 Tax=Oedothorax gibbosus TaxID=931172 RepID=A0AAV6VWA8_9ARAC|nr:hypothetical protein JTE90_006406 [Oedothorax gibbosus]
MEKSPKKFSIPVDIDDSFDDEPSSDPRCFKPGTIYNTSEMKKTPTPSTSVQSTSEIEPQTQQSKQATLENCPAFSAKEIERKEPGSRFESEFGLLRESKFYDKSAESSVEGNLGKTRNFSALIVNPRQRGNPLLKHIRNVPWEYSEIEPDYVLGKSSCALFLSLRYHNLFPNYIHDRLKALGKSYNLRVLLVLVDVAEPNPPLKDLSVISILADCTLMVSWSAEEAGSYLETYKMFENKSADLIKEKQDSDNYSQLIDCLTTIRSINKTDAMVLLSTFKTLKGIIQASVEDLTKCPGLGPLKLRKS